MTRKLEANKHDLPLYAEAAPAEFLDIIERDLRAEKSEVVGLLRPASTGIFGSCPRTGLLWALECLAWNPTTFPRVVNILGQLSEVEINDNWANKPIESLGSILRAWMPQTAANNEMRLKAVSMLLDKHPAVGWRICLQQFGNYGSHVGGYSHKPKWRPDGYGFGEPFKTWEPIHAFVREMVKVALSRPSYTVDMLCDLVSKLHALAQEDQARVWKIIDEWHNAGVLDEEVAKLRDKIRVTVLSCRGRKKANEEGQANLTEKAKAVYAELQPKDIVNKYEWLFRHGWVELAADELAGDEMDFQVREQHIENLRFEALTDIVQKRSIPGILALSAKVNS